MKKSIKKNIHSGEQPVRVLKHNLTTRLVERNKKYIESLQSDFLLEKEIKYHITSLPLVEKQMPFIDGKGVINLHETFLSYVWINCYYFFVLHEEGFAIPNHIDRGETIHKSQNTELLEVAKELFCYGISLIRGFIDWDKDNFPNPEYFDEDTEEGWYILHTNDIFVEVVNFILYHETAHAELEHIKKIQVENLSDQEIKKLEKEADSRAIELMVSNSTSNEKAELAVAIGLASMLFFSNSLDGGKRHPSLDQRIDNAVELLKPQTDSEIWTTLYLFLKVWDWQFKLGTKENSSCKTIKDLFYDLLAQVR